MFPFPRDTAGSVGTQAQGTTGAKCVVTTSSYLSTGLYSIVMGDQIPISARSNSVFRQTIDLTHG